MPKNTELTAIICPLPIPFPGFKTMRILKGMQPLFWLLVLSQGIPTTLSVKCNHVTLLGSNPGECVCECPPTEPNAVCWTLLRYGIAGIPAYGVMQLGCRSLNETFGKVLGCTELPVNGGSSKNDTECLCDQDGCNDSKDVYEIRKQANMSAGIPVITREEFNKSQPQPTTTTSTSTTAKAEAPELKRMCQLLLWTTAFLGSLTVVSFIQGSPIK